MSDRRTSGAWKVRSLDQVRAWKRPEPTKWAVVVIFLARVANRENKIFSRNNFGQNRTKRARASAVVISRSTPSCYGIVADTEHSNNAQKPPSPPIHMWGRTHPHGEFWAQRPATPARHAHVPSMYLCARDAAVWWHRRRRQRRRRRFFISCWSWWRSWLSPCVYRACRRQ
jgi:hypothetical protein